MWRAVLLAGWVLLAAATRAAEGEAVAFDKAADLAGWQAESGDWAVQDGALLQNDAGLSRGVLWRPERAWSALDLSVEFFIHPVGEGVRAPGLIYHAVDQDTYYYLHFDLRNSQVVWVRSAPGREWTDARRHRVPGLKAGAWQTARVVCRDGEHQAFLDGELLFTEKDDTLKGGVVGLRAGQGRIAFRNLRVEGEPVGLTAPFRVQVAPFRVVCRDAGAGAYEAFPDLCRTSTGELLCVFYAGYSHVSVPRPDLPNGARIALCRSSDDGRTWSPAETVVDTPIDDRDSSITQIANGDLLVAYMSYDPQRKPGTHQVFTVRSTDQGRTWGPPQRVPTPFTANEAVSEPIREMPDGRLILPLYGRMADAPKARSRVGLVESTDSGRTWQTLAVVRSDRYDLTEPSLVRLPDGRLFMVIRPTMTWCESTDGGRTWTEPAPLPIDGDAPYLLLTSKGVLLCGFRHRPTRSTCVISSTDFGRTWSERVTIDRVMGAYTSMVELPDGRVLVVYYTEGHGSDIRAIALSAPHGMP